MKPTLNKINSAKTAAERKQAERARKRAVGLVSLHVWVPRGRVPQVKLYAQQLRTAPK